MSKLPIRMPTGQRVIVTLTPWSTQPPKFSGVYQIGMPDGSRYWAYYGVDTQCWGFAEDTKRDALEWRNMPSHHATQNKKWRGIKSTPALYTGWYDPEQKPVRSGVYVTRYPVGGGTEDLGFAYYSVPRKAWYPSRDTPDQAMRCHAGRPEITSVVQRRFWQGLAVPL